MTEHTTTTYEGADDEGNPIEQEHDVKDEMFVRYIGSDYFAFHLAVVGRNFHTGEVSGLGHMTTEEIGATEMGDCQLKFKFRKHGLVVVEEVDCEYYHGANVYFDVELNRQ